VYPDPPIFRYLDPDPHPHQGEKPHPDPLTVLRIRIKVISQIGICKKLFHSIGINFSKKIAMKNLLSYHLGRIRTKKAGFRSESASSKKSDPDQIKIWIRIRIKVDADPQHW
jgi:hypothetical protein